MSESPPIAEWQSKTGRWYLRLRSYGDGNYGYIADGAGGSFQAADDDHAIAIAQERYIDTGYCQPDANKTPLRRVI